MAIPDIHHDKDRDVNATPGAISSHSAGKRAELLLVAVSASPYSESLILWAHRAALNLGAHWIAVHVEVPKSMGRKDRVRLEQNIELARSLGAEIIVTQEGDVTGGILRISRQRNVTQIIAGKPGRRTWLDLMFFKSPVRRLIRESGKIDVSVVRAGDSGDGDQAGVISPLTGNRWKRVAAATGLLATAIALNHIALPFIGPRSVALVLLLTVVLAALFLGRSAVIAYAAASALLWNFIFIPPRFTFYILHVEDAIMFFAYFFIALVVGSLTTRIRNQEKSSRNREEQLNLLYTMTKQFTSFTSIDEAAHRLVVFIRHFLNSESAIFLSEGGILADTPHTASTALPGPADIPALGHAFRERVPAGRFTGAFEQSSFIFLPLRFSRDKALGVIGVLLPPGTGLSMNRRTIIEALAAQFALFIEREITARDSQRARINEESEKLYKVLLDSVSHELRTPLAAIKGSISTILESELSGNSELREKLLVETGEAADRLIRMVDSLLDMGRIESGRLVINSDWNDMEDIINVTLGRLDARNAHGAIRVNCPEDIPLVRVDYNLVSLALYGMVHNAAVHAGPAAEIGITVSREIKGVSITVEDNGPGFDEVDLPKVFEKFYRGVARNQPRGLGLGLSISRGIAELHGGAITAGNRLPRGAVLTMALPVDTMDKTDGRR